MSQQKFASIWDAIENTAQEAENMKLRSALIRCLQAHVQNSGLSQAQAASMLSITQPRVSDLMRGKINLFSLDALTNMVAACGLHIELRVLETA